MKKTGTITFHASNNNGSFLQAYALQKIILDKLKINNEIINLCSSKTENLYRLIRPIKKSADVLRTIVSILLYKKLKKREECFDIMRKRHLKLSKLLKSESEALDCAQNYDCVIAGSDQIWNITAHDFVKSFFLPNVKTKKITYAISCGSNINSMDLSQFAEYINGFSELSTREINSAKIISNIYKNGDVKTVLDPTLLLNQEQYADLYDADKRMIEKPYIFLYSINYNKEVLKTAKRMSKIMGLPVVTIFNSYHAIMSTFFGIKVIYDAGPAEFLNLMKNAKCVLTNSFHGTAFSIIFKKQFYHLTTAENGHVLKDDRINGLLAKLDLDQDISFYSTEKEIFEKSNIDYVFVYNKLEILRKESFDYLEHSLL